jgi:SDR family mycofactocin-dependent oxidoreductase
MGRLDGKVALVTGAARGQGRAEAVRFAAEGANVVLIDICAAATETDYPPAAEADLAESAAAVEQVGRVALPVVADVRDLPALERAVAETITRFGRLDVVVANAGVVSWGRFWEMCPKRWQDMIDINLTGVYNTLRAATPAMIEAGNGGSIIATSSVAGLKSMGGQAHYSAAKHAVVGLVKSAAIELAPYSIRVNSVHPWGVNTPMVTGTDSRDIIEKNPTYQASWGQILFDPPISQPEDIANTVLFLASEESRTITGAQITVDHGATKV